MNKVKGNMYSWVTETRNPLAGKCQHDCKYCYMKSYPFNQTDKYRGEPRMDEKELEKINGSGKLIFVCSGNDLFGEWVPKELLLRILEHCRKYDNTYLFQSKNPKRFEDFLDEFPRNVILGTTIETNRDYQITNAPLPRDRCLEMNALPKQFKKMISIEPVMDFDLYELLSWICSIKPDFVSIGADSKGHNLSEPSKEKIIELIKELNRFTKVKIKSNLKRLMK